MLSTRFRPGQTVGRYELLRPIGSGGAGTVYEACDRALGRTVALKLLHGPVGEGAMAGLADARFFREGRAAAQVRHPHVVAVFDIGIEEGSPFLVMELVDGETLAQHLRHRGKLTVPEAVEIVLPLISAVADLHAAGIVHRDIKPANVLLARGREIFPKLADFGVSRMDDGSPTITRSGAVVGTPEYMAPELLSSREQAHESSDQYSLGVLLYELTTGEKPFRGETTYELMRAVVAAGAVAPSAREPTLPQQFDAVVLRAMRGEARERFPSVDDFAAALLPFASPATAARWRAEFADRENVPEDGDTPYRGVARTSHGPAPRRWGRRVSGVLVTAVLALFATPLVLLGVHARKTEARTASIEPTAAQNIPAPPASDEPPPSPRITVAAVPSAAPVEEAPPRRQAPLAPSRRAQGHGPTEHRAPLIGENGAPILDVP